mmetsp:Transcript_105334/g.336961  ORF Transcript_105334/g.336961 Transcript_105334/m.336961 type:complete len:344 (+) Transcript_105334:574-1605(+)
MRSGLSPPPSSPMSPMLPMLPPTAPTSRRPPRRLPRQRRWMHGATTSETNSGHCPPWSRALPPTTSPWRRPPRCRPRRTPRRRPRTSRRRPQRLHPRRLHPRRMPVPQRRGRGGSTTTAPTTCRRPLRSRPPPRPMRTRRQRRTFWQMSLWQMRRTSHLGMLPTSVRSLRGRFCRRSISRKLLSRSLPPPMPLRPLRLPQRHRRWRRRWTNSSPAFFRWTRSRRLSPMQRRSGRRRGSWSSWRRRGSGSRSSRRRQPRPPPSSSRWPRCVSCGSSWSNAWRPPRRGRQSCRDSSRTCRRPPTSGRSRQRPSATRMPRWRRNSRPSPWRHPPARPTARSWRPAW